ncbi:unnamed protein product, partial [Nesidiocoris tenuis]
MLGPRRISVRAVSRCAMFPNTAKVQTPASKLVSVFTTQVITASLKFKKQLNKRFALVDFQEIFSMTVDENIRHSVQQGLTQFLANMSYWYHWIVFFRGNLMYLPLLCANREKSAKQYQ